MNKIMSVCVLGLRLVYLVRQPIRLKLEVKTIGIAEYDLVILQFFRGHKEKTK